MLFGKIFNFRTSAARILLLILGLLFVGIRAFATDYAFSGKVVDRNGRPIPGVVVIIEKEEVPSEADSILSGTVTDEKGDFTLVKEASSRDSIYLYLTPPSNSVAVNPFYPPFSKSLARTYPQLFKKRLHIGRTRIINLGILRSDFPFTPIRLSLGNTHLVSDDLFKLWVVLMDRNGKNVEEVSLGELQNKGALSSSFEVSLFLPRGTWIVKTCGDAMCKSVFGSSPLIRVGRKPLSLSLR